jgi:hypothetical protein
MTSIQKRSPIETQLINELSKYNIKGQNIDPYNINNFLNPEVQLNDKLMRKILKHLVYYTYKASATEVHNKNELNKINESLVKIETMIKKMLKEPEEIKQEEQKTSET